MKKLLPKMIIISLLSFTTSLLAQKPISITENNPRFLWDINNDGIMEILLPDRNEYDYPDNTILSNSGYYMIANESNSEFKIINGVFYYPIENQEAGSIIIDGKNYIPIRSQEDMNKYVNKNSQVQNVFYENQIYLNKQSDTPWLRKIGLGWWSILNGRLVKKVEEQTLDGSIKLIGDFNNDNQPDILLLNWEQGLFFYLSDQDNYRKLTTEALQRVDIKDIDVNKDGKTDFFYFKEVINWPPVYKPYFLIQNSEGSFYEQPVNIETDPEKLKNKPFATGGNGLYYAPTNTTLGGVWLPDESYYKPEEGTKIMDINRDGYPDIVNQGSGLSYLSLGNNTYYEGNFNGMVKTADLNGDEWPDFVTIDSDNGDVKILWSTADGFSEQILFQNKLSSDIHLVDYDKDGDLDIIITMDTPKRGDKYGYIAFMRNDGEGVFKKKERSITGECIFHECADFSGDGTYSLTVMVDGICYIASWDSALELQLTPLPFSFGLYSPGQFIASDFDSNGKLEFIGDYIYKTDEMYSYVYRGLFEPASLYNSAPQINEAPKVMIDPDGQRLRIEWKPATDKETHKSLLTYNVRIGSQPGLSDIVVANSVVDGKRANYSPANAGNYTFFYHNLSALQTGTYYVAVQAIDPMNATSKWSPEAVYNHTNQKAGFLLSSSILSTYDTLVVESALPFNATYNYSFSVLPEGKLVRQEQGKAYFTFASMGNKEVKLTLQTPSGEFSSSKNIHVSPLSLYRKGISTYCSDYFDFDADGYLDGMENNKIYANKKGELSVLGRSFNTELNFGDSKIVDFNLDGYADMMNNIKRNNVQCNVLVNDEDLDFSFDVNPFKMKYKDGTIKDAHTVFALADFDNDGQEDVVFDDILFKRISQYEYEATDIIIPKSNRYFSYLSSDDFNKDGLWDIVYNNNSQMFILINEGDFKFKTISIDGYYSGAIQDINNDGYPDLIHFEGFNEYDISAYLGGPTSTFMFHKYGNRAPYTLDINNDGHIDFEKQISENGFLRNFMLISDADGSLYELEIFSGSLTNNYRRSIFADYDKDGFNEKELIKIHSNVTNEIPSVPQNVFARQTEKGVKLTWQPASDKETPAHSLLYNISLKKKGKSGINSYIISPLNATRNEAATVMLNKSYYRRHTTLEVPIERFETGVTYQLQVQTIDNWGGHSDFSPAYEFTVSPNIHLTLPEKGIVNRNIALEYHTTGGVKPQIDTDGGIWVNDNTLRWETPGLKNLKVNYDGAVSDYKILILNEPAILASFPASVIGGTSLTIPAPIEWAGQTGNIKLDTDNGSKIFYNQTAETLTVQFEPKDGICTVSVILNTDLMSTIQRFKIAVVESDFMPQISLVTTDSRSGKNKICWSAQQPFADAAHFGNKVRIYKESNMTDYFTLIGEALLSDLSFVDMQSNPALQSNRYRITLSTLQDDESMPSNAHSSVHLMLNKGMGNDINLTWTPYQGGTVRQYKLLYGTTPENMTELTALNGNSVSYTHKRNSSDPVYYAISYNELMPQSSAKRVINNISETSALSNIMCSTDAIEVTKATSVVITAEEPELKITSSQPLIHLRATVFPASASLNRVQWEVTSGNDIATVDQYGVVMSTDPTRGGSAVVRATAIDGSGIFSDVNIALDILTSSSYPAEGLIQIYTQKRHLYIKGITQPTSIMIFDSEGKCINHIIEMADLIIPLSEYPQGVYIVKVGNKTRKLIF